MDNSKSLYERVKQSVYRQVVLPDSSLRHNFKEIAAYCKLHRNSLSIGRYELNGGYTERPIGTISLGGGGQRIRSVNLFHNVDEDNLSLKFNHGYFCIYTKFSVPLSLIGDLYDAEKDSDEMFFVFTSIAKDMFVESAVKAIERGTILEKSFFDGGSVLFGDSTAPIKETLVALCGNLVEIVESIDKDALSADTDVAWLSAVKHFNLLRLNIRS